MLERLRRNLADKQKRLRELLAVNDRELNENELREFDALTGDERSEESIAGIEARITQVEQAQTRAARANAELGGEGDERPGGAQRTSDERVRVISEPETYRKGGQTSYFRDLATITMQRPGLRQAAERMDRNAREAQAGMQERALTTVDTAGGDFVPPVWMIDQFVAVARAARVTADLVTKQELPAGTDSINLPTIATGTAVAEQTTQNTAVQNTDATTGAISATVTTLAGQQVIALQLLEQSPVNMDEILLSDLALDYAAKLDVFVLSNNAAGKLGIRNVSGVNAVSVTATGVTAAGGLYPSIANGTQLIHTNRFLPPTVVVMHPRRWASLVSAVDSTGRPLVVPDTAPGFNALATQQGVQAQARVGTIQGLDTYTDPNLPTNLGAGTNQDPVIVMRAEDLVLYEGQPRSEAFRETKADQLSVLLRFYNYVAFQGGRYPKSIAVLSGVGLVPPTF